MSIDGETWSRPRRACVVHAGAPRARSRMSLSLVAITSRSIGRPMRLGDVAGEDVAEVAGRHREATPGGAARRARRRRRSSRSTCATMRAQLMELTPASCTRSRKPRSLNIAFTSAWQSSKVPLDRRRRARWASVGGRHHAPLHVGDAALGNRTTASTRSEPRNASMAAPPVSPEVAADDGERARRGRQHAVHQPRQELHGHVLEGQRRPVKQLQHPQVAIDLDQRRDGGMAEAGVGVAGEREQLAARDGSRRANGSSSDAATSANGLPAKAAIVSRGELGPGLRHVEPAVARQARQQRVLEAELGRFASGADVSQGSRTFARHEGESRISRTLGREEGPNKVRGGQLPRNVPVTAIRCKTLFQ